MEVKRAAPVGVALFVPSNLLYSSPLGKTLPKGAAWTP